MALLLPQCAPPEPVHHQLSASIRHRRLSSTTVQQQQHRSRRAGARATHGATESSTHTSTDHFKVPSTEPCCNLMSPLVMTPRKPARRSSRLRVRKGRDEIKTDLAPGSEMDAAEWISRVLANNGVVEVDPVTMAEQMQHLNHHDAKQPVTEYYSTNTHYYNESPNLTSSSEPSHDYYPPVSGNGFPRVPLGVALAAGSAVALAAVAVLVQSLNNNRQRDGGTISSPSSTSGGNNSLTSDFTGEPVTPDQGSQRRTTRDNKNVPAEVLAGTVSAGAAIFQPGSVRTGRSTDMPSPPSLSKLSARSSEREKPRSQSSKYESVTPFFSSDRSQTVSSYSRGSPPVAPRWREDKYKSVPPFFPSDKLAAATPFVPDEQGSEKSESGSESSKGVTPFFQDEVRGKGASYMETVKPFFPVAQGSKKSENGFESSKAERGKGRSYMETVPPFFPDEQGSKGVGKGSESSKAESEKGRSYMETVTPFFPVGQGSKRVGKGSESSKTESGKGRSYMETVKPFFPDEQGSIKVEKGSESSKAELGKGRSYMETVKPFFADERGNRPSYMETVTPFFADEQQSSRNAPSYMETVPPFFPDEQQSSLNGPSYMETVTPFFDDEEQGRSATGVSQSKGTIDLENVKPFFPVGTSSSRQSSGGSRPSQAAGFWDGESSSGAQRHSSATSPTMVDFRGNQMLAEVAGKAQGLHNAFMEGTTEERFASNTSGAFSFQGEENAPSMLARELSPEELALLEEIKAEEERRYAKMQALQAAFPALAMGAGAVGALVGVDGAFEMVGLTATASFISYELLWANKRKQLLEEVSRITDHHKLFRFLQKRKIVKDDC